MTREELSTWTVWTADTGAVYREITRPEADDLVRRGYGSLCFVSPAGAEYLRRYNANPDAEYKGMRFWRQILSSLAHRSDWQDDYLRIHVDDEEAT